MTIWAEIVDDLYFGQTGSPNNCAAQNYENFRQDNTKDNIILSAINGTDTRGIFKMQPFYRDGREENGSTMKLHNQHYDHEKK